MFCSVCLLALILFTSLGSLFSLFFFQLGTRLMRLVERTSWNIRQVKTERSGRAKERKGKEEAEGALKKAEKEIEKLQEELRKEKEASVQRVEDMGKLSEDLEISQGVAESFRAEMERMQGLVVKKDEELLKRKGELEEANKTLEKVEKEANITYQQFVEAFMKSQDFPDEVNAAAGSFHAEGFRDCLNFVGVGNTIDPVLHTVERFQATFLGDFEVSPQADANAEGELVRPDQLEIGGVFVTFEEHLNPAGGIVSGASENPVAGVGQGIGASSEADVTLNNLRGPNGSGVEAVSEVEVNLGVDATQTNPEG